MSPAPIEPATPVVVTSSSTPNDSPASLSTIATALSAPPPPPPSIPAASAASAESSGLTSYDAMTVSFSVPYIVLFEPAQNVFASSNAYNLWNDPQHQQQQQSLSAAPTQLRSFDNLASIQNTISMINREENVVASVTIDKRSRKMATIALSGTSAAVLTERARVLRSYYEIGIDHVGIDTFQLLNKEGNIQKLVAEQLEAIANFTSTSIFITNTLDPSLRPQNPTALDMEEIWKPYHILTYGDLDSIAFAKTRLALLIDDLNGFFIDRIAVPFSTHPLLAGREQANFQKITQDTNTKLYTPTLFPCVHASMDDSHPRREYDDIFIVGQEASVDRARDMIDDLVCF